MTTYFISDLHLTEQRPDITASLHYFIEHIATDAQTIYILGDLFEFWVGDDHKTALNQDIAALLHSVNKKGVKLFYIHGNRDFMIGHRYAKLAGITLLDEHSIIDLNGCSTLILHGDTLCTQDVAYQQYRRKVHQPWRQQLFLALPLFIRKKIANKIRTNSSKANQVKTRTILDVSACEVEKQFALHQVTTMIHGHTHRPDIHHIEIEDKNCKRVVLGDWDNAISYLKVTPQGMKLETAPLVRS